ncbi:hypothetical protein D3C73_1024550 [compost metagenome]
MLRYAAETAGIARVRYRDSAFPPAQECIGGRKTLITKRTVGQVAIQPVIRILGRQIAHPGFHIISIAVKGIPLLRIIRKISSNIESAILPDYCGIAEERQFIRLVCLDVAGKAQSGKALGQQCAHSL